MNKPDRSRFWPGSENDMMWIGDYACPVCDQYDQMSVWWYSPNGEELTETIVSQLGTVGLDDDLDVMVCGCGMVATRPDWERLWDNDL